MQRLTGHVTAGCVCQGQAERPSATHGFASLGHRAYSSMIPPDWKRCSVIECALCERSIGTTTCTSPLPTVDLEQNGVFRASAREAVEASSSNAAWHPVSVLDMQPSVGPPELWKATAVHTSFMRSRIRRDHLPARAGRWVDLPWRKEPGGVSDLV